MELNTYIDLYGELLDKKCYNLHLLDGALIQFMYRFRGNHLVAHRLAFFPSPYLEDYKSAQDRYEKDALFGDVVRETIMPFPIRFDYSEDQTICRDIYHSRTHLTLGEFLHCRIPVSAPLTPSSFISFILRHFYLEDKSDIINERIYNMMREPFPDTIKEAERGVSHFVS